MRVIAGEFRGRKLLPPQSEVTRPVTDRVKQSLFDILSPSLPEAVVYDCFAGTGSMGLECLSRGAKHATFFEADRSAVERLRKNIDALGVKDRATLVTGDLFKWFACASAKGQATVIFLDPPYRFLREKPEALLKLTSQFQNHLTDDGIVIFRHDTADSIALPPLQVVDVRTYGSMTLEFLTQPTTNNPQPTTDK